MKDRQPTHDAAGASMDAAKDSPATDLHRLPIEHAEIPKDETK